MPYAVKTPSDVPARHFADPMELPFTSPRQARRRRSRGYRGYILSRLSWASL